MSVMEQVEPNHSSVTMENERKKTSTNAKLVYINDTFGHLVDSARRLPSRQNLSEIVDILLHFKHQLVFLKQNNITFEQAHLDWQDFSSDFDNCSQRLAELANTISSGGILQDSLRERETFYSDDPKQYQSFGQNSELFRSAHDQIEVWNIVDELGEAYLTKKIESSQEDVYSDSENDDDTDSNENSDNENNSNVESRSDMYRDSDQNNEDNEPPYKKKKMSKSSESKEKLFSQPQSRSNVRKLRPRQVIKQKTVPIVSSNKTTKSTKSKSDSPHVYMVDFSFFKQPNMAMFFATIVRQNSQIFWKCKIPDCDVTRSSSDAIASHIHKHFEWKPYRCVPNCGYKSYSRKVFLRHCRKAHQVTNDLSRHLKFFQILFKSGKNSYGCNIGLCPFESSKIDALQKHMIRHLNSKGLQCSFCERRFSLSESRMLSRHLNRHHSRQRITNNRCFHPNCDYNFENDADINEVIEHMRANHSFVPKVPETTSSGASPDDQDESDYEMREGEDEEEMIINNIKEENDEEEEDQMDNDDDDDEINFAHRCSFPPCRFKSKSMTQVQAHEFRRHLSLKCSENDCGILFNSKKELKEHKLEAHQIYPHPCQVEGCEEGFLDSKALKFHAIKMHPNIHLTCTVCNRNYRTPKNLRRHKRNYHVVGPYQCPKEDCDFECTYHIGLIRHIDSKHRDVICTFEGCGQKVHRYLYNTHMNRHLNIKKHVCSWPECDKSFVDRKSLKDHIRIHCNYKRFQCTFPNCDYAGSEQRSNVIKHIRIKHLKLPYTKRQERELNIDFDSLPQKPYDFLQILPEDVPI